jgi:hypothetical protein
MAGIRYSTSSFHSHNTQASGLFGGESYSDSLYLVGSTEDELWLRLWLALFGTWLHSSIHLVEIIHLRLSSATEAPGVRSSPSTSTSGERVVFAIKFLPWT